MAATKTSIAATIDSVAQPSGWGLLAAYHGFPYRGEAVRDPLPTAEAQAILEATRALFARADAETLKEFALLALSGPMPGDLPFALNGVRLENVPLPSAAEMRDYLIDTQNWLGDVDDEDDAEGLLAELANSMGLAAHGIERHYGDAGLANAYIEAAQSMPCVERLYAARVPRSAAEAHRCAARLFRDLGREQGADAVTMGLARALEAFTDGQRFHFLPETVRATRKEAGLTQEALADRLGITARHVVRLEKGDSRVTEEMGRRIADACRRARIERDRQAA